MILGNIYEPGIFPGSNSKKEEAKLGKEKLVVTLCGSLMFKKEFEKIKEKLEALGFLVYTPIFFENSEHKPPMEELTMIHEKKIDLADVVFIVNVNGYVGKDTRKEIQYAEKQNKNIVYLNRMLHM